MNQVSVGSPTLKELSIKLVAEMQVDEEELFTVRLKKPPFKEKPCKVVSLQFPSYENMHLSTHIYASETIILKSSLHESMN